MSWTTPADLKTQVQRLWDRGLLLADTCGGQDIFPRRLTLKRPNSRELSERFHEVREWISKLSEAATHYRIEWSRINHRVLGNNAIPVAIWIDRLDDALGFIGKRRAAGQFAEMVSLTTERQRELLPWLAKRPLRALDLASDWQQLLSIVSWMDEHPRPSIYLRQIDLPGVHTKFIEGHRGVLGELLDLVLPSQAIDSSAKGVGGFCRRYGFRDKPLRVRLRVLDSNLALLQSGVDQDLTLTQSTFSTLDLPVSKVFITENEINFLAFPDTTGAMVIFGAGYGFENLSAATWLFNKEIHYWGDIDTHGFAILNQLRRTFPQAKSFLMDQRTLLNHRSLWGIEKKPESGDLGRLTAEEHTLYDHLHQNHWGDRIRLEQERIGFNFLRDALQRL